MHATCGVRVSPAHSSEMPMAHQRNACDTREAKDVPTPVPPFSFRLRTEEKWLVAHPIKGRGSIPGM